MLTVENGTGLIDSDSYISLEDARTYADNYGYELPFDNIKAEIALRKGAVYVDLYEHSFSGDRTNDDQALAWPRIYAYTCSGNYTKCIDKDDIPKQIKYAQVIAAHYYGQDVQVRVNDDGNSIASEEVVGAVRVSYFDNQKTGANITITESEDAMNTLMCRSLGFTVRSKRV